MKPLDVDGIADFAFFSPSIVGENDNRVDRMFLDGSSNSSINRNAHLVADDIRIVSADEVKECCNSFELRTRQHARLSEDQLRDLIDEKFGAAGHSELFLIDRNVEAGNRSTNT